MRRPAGKTSVVAALAAVLGAGVAYYFVQSGTPAKTPDIPAANNPQRFIGGADDGYVDAVACARCHPKIAATYSQTGMGRPFYAARPGKIVEDFPQGNTYYHKASESHYTI